MCEDVYLLCLRMCIEYQDLFLPGSHFATRFIGCQVAIFVRHSIFRGSLKSSRTGTPSTPRNTKYIVALRAKHTNVGQIKRFRWLTDFNGMSNRLGLFHALGQVNRTHCTSPHPTILSFFQCPICLFLCPLSFFLFLPLSLSFCAPFLSFSLCLHYLFLCHLSFFFFPSLSLSTHPFSLSRSLTPLLFLSLFLSTLSLFLFLSLSISFYAHFPSFSFSPSHSLSIHPFSRCLSLTPLLYLFICPLSFPPSFYNAFLIFATCTFIHHLFFIDIPINKTGMKLPILLYPKSDWSVL